MKKIQSHSFQTWGLKEFNVYKKRLKKVRLIWPQQILDLLKSYKITKINDLGCNYFQFYKEIKLRKLKYNYFGYDNEKKFINLGLNEFKELNKKYILGDLEKINFRKCDCTIISATLEHLKNPIHVLKKIVKSTKKVIIIRSSFGIDDDISTYSSAEAIIYSNRKKITNYGKANAKTLYNQYSFKKTYDFFISKGFELNFMLDKATYFSQSFKRLDKKKERKIYICLATKINQKYKIKVPNEI